MKRIVKPELLDLLPPKDLLALGSRRDLRRLNGWMGHSRIMARQLNSAWAAAKCCQVADLGAGDGHFLLRLARRWRGGAPQKALLVDRQALPHGDILHDFARLGWNAEFVTADVFHWLEQTRSLRGVGLITNLFLHHFAPTALERLLQAVAGSATFFLALEPRRSIRAALGSRAVGLLGCNRITRHDAAVSVQAGFNGSELTRLWPEPAGWALQERPAGLFSHLFIAQRNTLDNAPLPFQQPSPRAGSRHNCTRPAGGGASTRREIEGFA